MSSGELPPTLASLGGAGDGGAEGDLVGRVLGGRYRILRKLGEGAMGAVYLGEHMKIGRQDAIKVLRDSLATDPDTIARFVRGTRNVSMIRHPNICTIYDYSDIAGGIQFVAMEFVPGETLRDLLQREGRLPLDTAVHIAVQAAEALDAAHEVGIVHRDLKPANIMVVPGRSGKLDVKVVDFDIAKGSSDGEGEEVTRMGFVVGTPEYMSPEQLIGEKLDGRSDIYSLALVLYRMLTGTLPFEAQDTQDLMVKRLTEEPLTLAAGFPAGRFTPALEATLRRALQRKPADRQATAADFGQELRASIEQPATIGATGHAAARPPAPLPGNPRPEGSARKIPMPALIGGGIGVAAALGLAAVLIASGGDPPAQDPLDSVVTPPPAVVEYEDPEAANGQVDAAPDAAAGEQVAGTRTAPQDEAPSARGTESGSVPRGSPPPTDDQLLSLMDGLTPDAANATVLSIRDQATAAWGHPDASPEIRARAAYVAGNAFFQLGDTPRAVEWLQRAVTLRPGFQAYRTLLETYQQQLSGY